MALSPMMRHYLETKEKYKDCILFYRLGDFYEMFFEDAELVSRELELTLTGKECGLEQRAPMCGVPYHSVDSYLAKLINKNYKVAICEQLEDPSLAKGLVDRDVVRIITPGTVIESAMLDDRKPNYIMSVYIKKNSGGFAICDLSTGTFKVWQTTGVYGKFAEEIKRIDAREIIVNDKTVFSSILPNTAASGYDYDAKYSETLRFLLSHFNKTTEEELGLKGKREAAAASGMLLKYLSDTQKNALIHILTISPYETNAFLDINRTAANSLELFSSLSGNKKASLLGLMDQTVTSMGGRLLREWLEMPLGVKAIIESRLDAVAYLKDHPVKNDELRERLKEIYDIERLTSKVAYDSINGRDCLALLRSLKAIPKIKNIFANEDTPELLYKALSELDPLSGLAEMIEKEISPDTPIKISEGGVIREGFSPELDELRNISKNAKGYIAALENSERDKTGIKNLKIGYNRVFGYYIEVTRSFYDLVPNRYSRRQTLANAERFTTDELVEFEKKALSADTDALRMEQIIFSELKDVLKKWLERLQVTTHSLKSIDALSALAYIASRNGYVRPKINEEGRYEVKAGRHPVVEQAMERGTYVPNDVSLDKTRRIMIITGPNMAGKSTYMRQTALIAIMAHMGSFVPADEADISITDKIYTRIGASDDLYGGRSTFMVEMSELAEILKGATDKSLILLDEVGRGTSTIDGLSIAWSTVEYLSNPKCGSHVLFATHYHELSDLEGVQDGVVNYRITAKELGDDVVFLRKVVPGGTDKSYGVTVAAHAGLPNHVIARARQIMARLETNTEKSGSIGSTILDKRKNGGNKQIGIGDIGSIEIVEEIRAIDVLSLSPIEALNVLFKLTEKVRNI